MRKITASGELFGEHITVEQISKTTARKLFAAGETVYFQSSNMYPFGVWQSICPVTVDREQLSSAVQHYNWCKDNGYTLPVYKPTEAGQFEQVCNEFAWYNCDNERGRYVTFYKKVS